MGSITTHHRLSINSIPRTTSAMSKTRLFDQAFSIDIKTEFAIIALRERRRFNQVRRLGIKVPDEYIRIRSIKLINKHIQQEILRLPHCILDDSEYESDSEVLRKYSSKHCVLDKIRGSS